MPSPIGIVASGAGTVAAFVPTDIAGLQFWLDADDAATFTFGTGTKVAQWNDKSGNNRHVAQATGANQPDRSTVYGAKTAVRFNNTDFTIMRTGSATTLTQPYTILAVAAITGSGSAAARILSHRGDNSVQLTIGENSANPSLYAGNAFVTQGSVPTANTLQQLTAIANGASSQVWGNGSAGTAGNAGTNSLDLVTIGASGNTTNWLNGDIAEVIVYNSALNAGNRQAVEAYLKAKWGTP